MCIEENHKRIHQQSEAREKLESEIAITGLNPLGAVILRAELDHALFAFSIHLMTVASVLPLEFIMFAIHRRFRSESFAIEATSSVPRLDASFEHYASRNSTELASIDE